MLTNKKLRVLGCYVILGSRPGILVNGVLNGDLPPLRSPCNKKFLDYHDVNDS